LGYPYGRRFGLIIAVANWMEGDRVGVGGRTRKLLISETLLLPRLLTIRNISFLLPCEFRCRPWVVNSYLRNDVVSIM
jgi:hypothetical protein